MSEESGSYSLSINEKYAEKYERWREKEELQKLKDKYGDVNPSGDAPSSSESESDDCELVDFGESEELGWRRTLSALKSKDPSIYDGCTTFFSEGIPSHIEKAPTSSKKPKPYTIKDYDREVILKKAEDGDIISESEESTRYSPSTENYRAYDQEQCILKKSLQEAAQKVDPEEDDSDEELFKIVPFIQPHLDVDSASYNDGKKTFSKCPKTLASKKDELGKAKCIADAENVPNTMATLENYWTMPNLDPGEQFLRDYFLKKQYLEEERGGKGKELCYEDVMESKESEIFSSEEDELQEQESFERKYNFRYEEPGADVIKSFPRKIETSVRRVISKRTEKRKRVMEKKAKIKEEKKADVRRLKNLTRKHLASKLGKLKQVSGCSGKALEQLATGALHTDFDPQEHDALMQKMFDENYYEASEDNKKPHFEYDPDIDGHSPGQSEPKERTVAQDTLAGVGGLVACPKGEPTVSTTTTRASMSCSKDVGQGDGLTRKPTPTFKTAKKNSSKADPEKSSVEQYLKDYYQLNYEDVVGGMPVRFKYRQVLPNDFGLTTEEILKAEDKELNSWCSLKKAVQYRTKQEELKDVRKFSAKAESAHTKRQCLPSLYRNHSETDLHRTIKKRQRKRRRHTKSASECHTHEGTVDKETSPCIARSQSGSRIKTGPPALTGKMEICDEKDIQPLSKRKKRHTKRITSDRLKAYGLHGAKCSGDCGIKKSKK